MRRSCFLLKYLPFLRNSLNIKTISNDVKKILNSFSNETCIYSVAAFMFGHSYIYELCLIVHVMYIFTFLAKDEILFLSLFVRDCLQNCDMKPTQWKFKGAKIWNKYFSSSVLFSYIYRRYTTGNPSLVLFWSISLYILGLMFLAFKFSHIKTPQWLCKEGCNVQWMCGYS